MLSNCTVHSVSPGIRCSGLGRFRLIRNIPLAVSRIGATRLTSATRAGTPSRRGTTWACMPVLMVPKRSAGSTTSTRSGSMHAIFSTGRSFTYSPAARHAHANHVHPPSDSSSCKHNGAKDKPDLSKAQRSHMSVACIMAAIDHFKAINNNHGHRVGDEH